MTRSGRSVVFVALVAVLSFGLFPTFVSADEPAWEAAAPIDTSAGGSSAGPRVSFDDEGNAIATWLQWSLDDCDSGARCAMRIWANRFQPSMGWGSPDLIGGALSDPLNNSYILGPEVAIDPTGDALVVWSTTKGGIWASYFNPSFGWDLALSIARGSEKTLLSGPQVAMDRSGGAVVLWQEDEWEQNRASIWASYFVPGAGWEAAVLIADNATNPQIAVDDFGNLIVVTWLQGGHVDSIGWWSRALGLRQFVPGQGWSLPTFRQPQKNWLEAPRVGLTPAMTAVLVWREWEFAVAEAQLENATLWGTSVNADLSWGQAFPLEGTYAGPPIYYESGPWTRELLVVADRTGNATAMFCSRSFFGDCADVRSARFALQTGWETVTVVRDTESTQIALGGIAADNVGEVTAVWVESKPYIEPFIDEVWARRYAPDRGWDTPQRIGIGPVVSFPDVAADLSGNVAVVWAQSDGTRDRIYASRLENRPEPDLTPPILTLSIPEDGFTSNESTVAVVGWTEPGATLAVNGLWVAVSSMGSFSVVVALAEGTNAITAVATDAAGNSATETLHVTYIRPESGLVGELAQTRGLFAMLLVLQTILATLVIALFLLYRNARGGEPGAGKPSEPRGPSETKLDAPQTNGPSPTKPRRSARTVTHRWNNGGPVKLTTKERVLLHLQPYAKYLDAAEVPPELTLLGVSESAAVDPRHLAQYTRPLVRDGLIRERMAHVKGVVQRRKVYLLTEEGRAKAAGVRERVKTATVRVRDASGVREAPIADVLAQVRGATVLDIVRAANQEGIVDLEHASP